MNFSYDEMLKEILKNYQIIEGNEKNYIVNSNDNIVGTLTENLIVLFYICNKEKIWNHKNMAAVAIAKDFVLATNNQIKKADVMYISGLCGACNDIQLIDNYYIEDYPNYELNFLEQDYQLGYFGIVAKKENKYCLISNNLFIHFIGNEYTEHDDQLNLLLLKENGITKIDYDKLYNYLKETFNWYYTVGYNNVYSHSKREYIESRKYKNYDNITKPMIRKIEKSIR